VRIERKELRAANAMRGNIAVANTETPVIFKTLRLLNFIVVLL
jgi:hypothetical protein